MYYSLHKQEVRYNTRALKALSGPTTIVEEYLGLIRVLAALGMQKHVHRIYMG
jgi:hypothetical protein